MLESYHFILNSNCGASLSAFLAGFLSSPFRPRVTISVSIVPCPLTALGGSDCSHPSLEAVRSPPLRGLLHDLLHLPRDCPLRAKL